MDSLAAGKKIPGFGHRVYKCEDPRATVLRKYTETVTRKAGDTTLYDITREIDRVMSEHSKVFPNVDLYTASLYHAMGIPDELFTPIFAMSRVTGWTAHIFEQWDNNRLIRPLANYTGPTSLKYVAMEQRTP